MAAGSGRAFCHLRPPWFCQGGGLQKSERSLSDSSHTPLQPKQQLAHLLGQTREEETKLV